MKILIVEDEKKLRDLLKQILESEFVLDFASDGEEGAYLAQTNDYDLIVMDNLMPRKNGLEACREIRADGVKTPILFLSVKTEVVTKVDALNAGADDYLTKPFAVEELLARIRALLRRPPRMKAEILTADNLTLDVRKHKVSRGDRKDIRLTRKEFMLLEYLLRNKGAVMSRAMIMEHVWDINADPFSNTIEAHILSLRKKIDLPGEKKLIITVPGCGYKIE